MRTALLVLLFVAASCLAQNPTNIVVNSYPTGTAGNGTIYYQPSGTYFTFQNVKNPITVEITYNSGTENTEASICLNSNANAFPVFGLDLESNCPSGAFGKAANTTETVVPPAAKAGLAYQRSYSNSKSQFIGARMALADDSDFDPDTDSIVASLYVKPGTAGLVVTLPDQDTLQNFQVFISGTQCTGTTYPVGTSGTCSDIATLASLANRVADFPLGAGAWSYYQWNINDATPESANSLSITVNGTDDGIVLYTQEGYYPTADWFLNAQSDEYDGAITYTLLNPGNPGSETFFFGVFNSGDASVQVHLNYTLGVCNTGSFGNGCTHQSATVNDPLAGVKQLNATLTLNSSGLTNGNNGTSWTFDYSDSENENDYAYFTLIDYPTGLNIPYYIRVTVADSEGGDAPAFFAKKGYYPSAQSANYNVSTEGDVAHQIIIEVTQDDLDNYQTNPEYTWYFGVQLPSKFAIWVGNNCANNCSAEEHGSCYCNGELCSVATTNYTNVQPYYDLPTSLVDSAGACTCDDDAYDESFDCATKNNPYLWLWILLIVIAVIVVIVIAVAVPAFFIYQQRQKRSGYDVIEGGSYD